MIFGINRSQNSGVRTQESGGKKEGGKKEGGKKEGGKKEGGKKEGGKKEGGGGKGESFLIALLSGHDIKGKKQHKCSFNLLKKLGL